MKIFNLGTQAWVSSWIILTVLSESQAKSSVLAENQATLIYLKLIFDGLLAILKNIGHYLLQCKHCGKYHI